jgi:hypothetical protein
VNLSTHLRDTSGPSDKDDLVDVGLLQAGILQHVRQRGEGLAKQIVVQLFELRAGERLREILAIGERLDLDLHLVDGRQRALRLLDLTTELRNGALVVGEIDVRLLLDDLGRDKSALRKRRKVRHRTTRRQQELPECHCRCGSHLDEVLHEALVEVLATQVRITVGRQHLEDALVDGQDGDIEGSATQIVDENVLLLRFLLTAQRSARKSRVEAELACV